MLHFASVSTYLVSFTHRQAWSLWDFEFVTSALGLSVLSFPGGAMVKNLLLNTGDAGSIPGSGRFPGGGNGKPLQYSCLEDPMDKGAWKATVHGVAKSWTRLSDFTSSLCEERVEAGDPSGGYRSNPDTR